MPKEGVPLENVQYLPGAGGPADDQTLRPPQAAGHAEHRGAYLHLAQRLSRAGHYNLYISFASVQSVARAERRVVYGLR